MSCEWHECSLGDCISLLSGGTPSKSNPLFWNGEIPWISAKDMKRFLLNDSLDHVSALGAKSGTRVVPAGTTLLLVRGMTLHNDVPICKVTQPSAFNQDVKAVFAKGELTPEFLPHLLVALKPALLAAVDSAGHGTGRLNTDTLLALPVKLPSHAVQLQIAELADGIEAKIALLRETNTTLEAIAQALFKSWFVDFDPVRAKQEGSEPEGMDEATAALFPDNFEHSEVGVRPPGWRWSTLAEAYEINPQRKLRKGETAPYVEMASVPTSGHCVDAVTTRDMGSGSKFRNGDSLLARITPCLENGKTAFVDFLNGGEIGWGSTEFLVLHPKAPLPEYHGYLLCRHQPFRRYAIQCMSGTSGRQRIQNEALAKFPIIVPSEKIAQAFDRIVTPIQQRVAANHGQSHTLRSLRDTLLPRLISGQLRLPEAEALVEEAAA